jgi:lantibiotic biosynthesis protein
MTYAAFGWALLRAPLLPAARDLPAASDALVPADARVRAAIAVGSPDLAAALARTNPGDPGAARLRRKLERYRIRMSTRPTPYGLFAGVGLVRWGSATDLALADRPPRTRTRPDMEWLLGLVERLERDPGVRSELSLVTNSTVLMRAGRAFVRRGSRPAASVRATGAVRRALALARAPIARGALAAELATEPGATHEKVARLIDDLLREGFLLLDLTPPPTAADPLGRVCDRLAEIPAARSARRALAALQGALAGWDELPIEERAAGWSRAVDRARAVHAGEGSANALQTDAALPLTGARVNAAIADEAARAAELLLRVGPYPYGSPRLASYRHAFEARYGPDRDVPLLELLDPDFGLGPLADGDEDATAVQAARARRPVLLDLALEALRERRLAIELDDDLVARLETWTPEAAAAPASLELSVFVAASSPAAIDDGAFRVVVGPNLGADAAGRGLGRFVDLLGPRAREGMAAVARAEERLARGAILAELVFTPDWSRAANVAVRPPTRAREIPIAAPPGVPADAVVPLDELVVGVRAGRLAVLWPAREAEVVAVQGHMLNPLQAPPEAAFLLEAARGFRAQLVPFDWGPAASFPFLPRVQRGRIVLSLARWRVDPSRGDLEPASGEEFASSLASWRERFAVPRHVYLAVVDNRLMLDLEQAEHVELLREELRRLPQDHTAVLEEALPGPDHAWLPGPDGGHLAELVVPLALAERGAPAAAPPAARTRAAGAAPSAGARLRLPGSDWLYAKLYGPRSFEDELIAGPLRSFGQFALGAGLSDGWFFVRYEDPRPHLRVRFHGEPTTLTGALMRELCEWAAGLVGDGVATELAIDTYEREVERYGGERGMLASEAVFVADSAAAADLLRVTRDGLELDATTLAVVSVDELLDALGVGAAERTELCRGSVTLSRADGR